MEKSKTFPTGRTFSSGGAATSSTETISSPPSGPAVASAGISIIAPLGCSSISSSPGVRLCMTMGLGSGSVGEEK